MIFKLFSRIRFLLKSQNQHGLHSPFVYDFVTKGLYKKRVKNSNFNEYSELKSISKKQQKVLSKIVKYFKIDTIYFDFKTFKNNKKNNYKLLYINNISNFKNINFDDLDSKNIIIFDKIHQNKKTEKDWQNIIKNKEITASIDLFYFGLIFFRKEQAKEHFIIRV